MGARSIWPRGGVAAIGFFLLLWVAAPVADATYPGKPGKIAFSKSNGSSADIFTFSPGQTPAPLMSTTTVHERDPYYSADGRSIVFTYDDGTGPEVALMPATGGPPDFLTGSGNASDNPAISPDGNMVVFEHFESGDDEIYIVSSSGGTATPLTATPSYEQEPSFSPDGSLIAFSVSGEIAVMPPTPARPPCSPTTASSIPPRSSRRMEGGSPLRSRTRTTPPPASG